MAFFIGWNMTEKYHVIATKKDGTTYEGMMTTKEPRVTNGLIGIASLDGSWVYISPDEISDIKYVPVVEK
ncbi:hypothetical protein [Proteus mirabilis]|uniref:hypothetical protein n=1 Tax=Proteus mirabilis TaxID=584 RepID=UPI003F6FB95D